MREKVQVILSTPFSSPRIPVNPTWQGTGCILGFFSVQMFPQGCVKNEQIKCRPRCSLRNLLPGYLISFLSRVLKLVLFLKCVSSFIFKWPRSYVSSPDKLVTQKIDKFGDKCSFSFCPPP